MEQKERELENAEVRSRTSPQGSSTPKASPNKLSLLLNSMAHLMNTVAQMRKDFYKADDASHYSASFVESSPRDRNSHGLKGDRTYHQTAHTDGRSESGMR